MAVVAPGTWADQVLACKTQEEADSTFEALLRDGFEGKTREQAEQILRDNIGYMGGYHSQKQRERMYHLFKTEHPIFGTYAPTFKEALAAGKRISYDLGYREFTEDEVAEMMELTKDLKKWRNT